MRSNKEKSVLVLIPRVPFPLVSGGRVVIYGTLRILAKYFNLHIIIVDDSPIADEQKKEISKFSDDVYYFHFSKKSFILNAAKSIFNNDPLQVNYFRFSEVQTVVDRLSTEVDCAFVFLTRMTQYLEKFEKPIFFNAVDSMFLNYSNSVENTGSLIWKAIYSVEIKRLFRYEKKCVEHFSLSYFVNKNEADFWRAYSTKVTDIPFSGDDSLLKFDDTSSDYANKLVFVGKLDYRPNIDALLWFIQKVLPHIDPTIELLVVGGFATEELKKAGSGKPVTFTGYVAHPELIIRSAMCNIAPMQTGGGLQTKVVSAMAVEGLVIGTSKSVSALTGARHKQNILIIDDPLEFAQNINSIYQNPQAYKEIRKEARKLIAQSYSWATVEAVLMKNIKETLKDR